jgi:hypothetical protein
LPQENGVKISDLQPQVELSCPTSTLFEEEFNIEDAPFLMDTAVQLLKKHKRSRGKRKLVIRNIKTEHFGLQK